MEVDTVSSDASDLFAQHDSILNSIQSKIQSLLKESSKSESKQQAIDLRDYAKQICQQKNDTQTNINDLLSTALRKAILNILQQPSTNSTDESFDAAIHVIYISTQLTELKISDDSRDTCVPDRLPLTLLETLFTFHRKEDLLNRIDSIKQCFDQFKSSTPKNVGTLIQSGIWAVKLVVCCINRDRGCVNPNLSGRLCLILAGSLNTFHMSGMNKRGLCNNEKRFDHERALTEATNTDVDVSLYRAFWKIQDMIMDPTKMDALLKWHQALDSLKKVLEAFEVIPKTEVTSWYASKTLEYFTAPSILHLQLSDPQLRQHVLLQFAIFLHYLEMVGISQDNAPKGQMHEIYSSLFAPGGDGTRIMTRVLSLLERDVSVQFRRFVSSMFVRERRWMHWKKKTGWNHLQNRERKEPAKKFVRRFTNTRPDEAPSPKRVRDLKEWPLRQSAWDSMPQHPGDPLMEKNVIIPNTETILLELQEDLDDDDITEDLKRKHDTKYAWKSLRVLGDQDISLLEKAVDSKAKKAYDLERCLSEAENKNIQVEKNDVGNPKEITST